METENIAEFVPLKDHDDYEILSTFPFTIRRKDNHYEVKETISNNGYQQLRLGLKKYLKHRLIAIQFIPNDDPEHKTDIDHINHDRADYHLENLRWCTKSENSMNRTSTKNIIYTFYNDIPDDSLKVTDYNEHTFEDYYYSENNFYFYNGINYRKLHINEGKDNYKFVIMLSTEHKKVKICFSKFKKMYDLD